MRLLVKFNLLLVLVFGGSIAATLFIARNFLQQNAHDVVIQQARLMMGAAMGMRTYTENQVKPLLKRRMAYTGIFLPVTVPAYSAMESFNYLRTDYRDYTYKEATLNPTNLRDLPTDWENDVIRQFRNFPEQKEQISERWTPEGPSLFLAHPIKVIPGCLDCHDSPSTAPLAVTKTYGREHGFGWKVGEVVGAQIVSVPAALPQSIADRAFKTLVLYLIGVFVVTLLLLDLGLALVVVRPVSRLSAIAEKISKGNLDVPEIPVEGSDEISQLARSFNRMYLSLVKAARLLESDETRS
jgi:protein-histidine pros-kinase